MNLQELYAKIAALRAELKGLFDKHKTATGEFNMTPEIIEQVQQKNAELADLVAKAGQAAALAEMNQQNELAIKDAEKFVNGLNIKDASSDQVRKTMKSISDVVLESAEYKRQIGHSQKAFRVELPDRSTLEIGVQNRGEKVITTATGFAPYNYETNEVVPLVTRRRMVTDLIPSINTTLTLIKWREQTVRARPNDMGVAEGGTKQPGDIQYGPKSTEVKKRAVYVVVTDEQLDDVPTFRSLIDLDLRYMIDEDAEEQIIAGDGTGANLEGFLTNSSVGSIAKGADEPVPDAVHRAITEIRVNGYAEPTDIVMHPRDYHDYRTLRTADGLYINGNPSDNRIIPIWGLLPVITPEMTENTTLLGAFAQYARLYRRTGVTIAVGYINNQFILNEQTILGEHRIALVILRPQAFYKVTGI